MHKHKLLAQIMGLAYLLNENSSYQVFVSLSGHVNAAYVYLKDPESDGNLAESYFYLDSPDAEKQLVEISSQLSDILTTGEIDYSRLHKGVRLGRETAFLSYDAFYCNGRHGDVKQGH